MEKFFFAPSIFLRQPWCKFSLTNPLCIEISHLQLPAALWFQVLLGVHNPMIEYNLTQALYNRVSECDLKTAIIAPVNNFEEKITYVNVTYVSKFTLGLPDAQV